MLTGWDSVDLLGLGYRLRGSYYFPASSVDSYHGEDGPTEAPSPFRSDHELTVVHEACWRLLLACFPEYDRDDFPRVLALHLALLAYFTPKNGLGDLLTAHDYGGLGTFRSERQHRKCTMRDHHIQQNSDLEQELKGDLRYVIAAPSGAGIDAALSWAKSPGRTLSPASISTPIWPSGSCVADDPFYRLPSEIFYATVSLLPSPDICSLREASRAAASLFHLSGLPQSFFASRFAPDREMGFFFAGIPKPVSREVNWRALYMGLWVSLRSETHPDIKSKRRIWSCLRPFAQSLRARIDQHYAGWGEAPVAPPRHRSHKPVGQVCAQRRSPNVEPVRLLDAWRLFFPTCPSHARVRVAVSFVTFNFARYLSGMSVSNPAGDTPEAPISVGMDRTGGEEVIHLLGCEVISGLHVYCRNNGVAGLGFVVRNLLTSSVSTRNVGDVDTTSTYELGVALLESSSEDSKISGLDLGFDVSPAALDSGHTRHCPLLTLRAGWKVRERQSFRCTTGQTVAEDSCLQAPR